MEGGGGGGGERMRAPKHHNFVVMYQSNPSLTIPPLATPGDSHILIAPGVGFSLLCLARGSAQGFAGVSQIKVKVR